MKLTLRSRLPSFLSRLVALLVVGWGAQSGAWAEARDSMVVVVTLDGFPNYVFHDPTASIPNLRALGRRGFAPQGGMEVSNPSTTWTNHTTLVTGVPPARHGVLFNGKLRFGDDGLPSRVDATAPQAELVLAPTLFDAAHAAGLRTAGISWPCTRAATGLDDVWPDTPSPIAQMNAAFRDDLIAAGVLRSEDKSDVLAYFGAGRDALRIDAACYLLKKRPPRLLLIHLTNTDGIQHEYGPDTPAAATAFAWADTLVGRLVETIESAGLRERTTLIITADHGFTAAEKTIVPDRVLAEAGFNPGPAHEGDTRPRARAMGGGGYSAIYFAARPSSEQVADLADRFRKREGVATVVTPDQFAAWGYPDPANNRDMASLVVLASDSYVFGAERNSPAWEKVQRKEPNRGIHGGPSTLPRLHALFVAVGPHISPSAPPGHVAILDVAPTLARLLGVDFPSARGNPISALLP